MKLLALLLAASSSAQAYDISQCYNFFALGFNSLDFDRYDEFYKADSTMTLAPAGTYYGANGIEEYVKFASPFSPFLEEFGEISFKADLGGFDEITGTCIFFRARDTYFKMSAPAVPGLEGELANYIQIQYKIDGHYISHVEVFFPLAFLDFYFGSALNTDGVRKYVCEVMRDSCPATWEANGYDSTGFARCVDDLESLSMSDPPPYVDGKSQGCRFLHAVFAAEDEMHCPHISFVPAVDVDGKEKCQTSAENPALVMGAPGSPFTDADKFFFEDFMRDLDFTDYKVNPTLPCGSTEDCPVGLVCEITGGRRLRFGAAKTGFCVVAE
jgi:hypothetical protein